MNEEIFKNEISTLQSQFLMKSAKTTFLENENNFLKIKFMVSETIANQSKETNIKYQALR